MDQEFPGSRMSTSNSKIDSHEEKQETILIEEPGLDPFSEENSDTGKTSRELLENAEKQKASFDKESNTVENESTTLSLPQPALPDPEIKLSQEFVAAGETQVHTLKKEPAIESSLHDTLVIPQAIPKESALPSIDAEHHQEKEKKEDIKKAETYDPFISAGISEKNVQVLETTGPRKDLHLGFSTQEITPEKKNSDVSKEISQVTPPSLQKTQKNNAPSKPPELPKKDFVKPPELPKREKSSENDLAKRLEQKNNAASDNWLFKKDGYVFGPVPPAEIIEKMYQFEIGGDTFVSKTMGSWQPIKEIDQFSIHLEKIAKIEEQKKKEQIEHQQKRDLLIKNSSKFGAIAAAVIAVIAILYFSVHWFMHSGEGKALAVLLQGEKIDFKKIDLISIEDIDEGEEDEETEPTSEKKIHRPKAKNPSRSKTSQAKNSAASEMNLDSWKAQETSPNHALLSDSEIETTLAKNFYRIKKCLIKAYQEQLDIPTRFEIDFAVMNSGKVGEVKFNRKKLTGAPTGNCIIDALRSITFREYIGETRNVTYPIEIGE